MEILKWALLAAIPAFVQAQEKPVDLSPHIHYDQPKAGGQLPQNIEVRESKYYKNGVLFRRVEYGGEAWEMAANQPESTYNCKMGTPLPPNSYALEGSVQIVKRTSLYIESLRQHCDGRTYGIVTDPNPRNTNIGIDIGPAKPGDSDKKILYNPLRNIGSVRTDF